MAKRTAVTAFLSLAMAAAMVTSSPVPACQQGSNCLLPKCFCPTSSHPMPAQERPMIVYFGFDDAVTAPVSQFYKKLFRAPRRNPNGCPITMSLYVSNAYTDYGLVHQFYEAGHEIGVHSVTQTDITTAKKLKWEASEQRNNLVGHGKVRSEDIVGWRSPNLITAGDAQPDVLKNLGFLYDISLTYSRRHLDDPKVWPATLDFGWPYNCNIPPCPGKNTTHPGFWEVPVNSLIDYKNQYSCVYVDGCYNNPQTKEEAVEYLWNNFLDFYINGKVPFGLNMHAAWFFYPGHLPAMEQFLDKILGLSDVYVVSVKQMMDWMQTPKTLRDIDQLKSWNCTYPAPLDPILFEEA